MLPLQDIGQESIALNIKMMEAVSRLPVSPAKHLASTGAPSASLLRGQEFRLPFASGQNISRKVAVTLPEFSFCFSKNVLTQSCSLSLGEMVPDIFVCWPGGPPPPPFNSTLARLGVNRSKTL